MEQGRPPRTHGPGRNGGWQRRDRGGRLDGPGGRRGSDRPRRRDGTGGTRRVPPAPPARRRDRACRSGGCDRCRARRDRTGGDRATGATGPAGATGAKPGQPGRSDRQDRQAQPGPRGRAGNRAGGRDGSGRAGGPCRLDGRDGRDRSSRAGELAAREQRRNVCCERSREHRHHRVRELSGGESAARWRRPGRHERCAEEPCGSRSSYPSAATTWSAAVVATVALGAGNTMTITAYAVCTA